MNLASEVKTLLRSHTSLDDLVEKTTIGYSTARRLYLGETKNVSPSNLLELACFVSQKKNIESVIKFFADDSHIRKALEKSFGYLVKAQTVTKEDSTSFNKFIVSDCHFKVFLHAQVAGGVSKEFIREEFGRQGEDVLADLIEKKVLRDEDGMALMANDDLQLTLDTAIRFAPSLFSYLKPENFSKASNIFQIHQNKVSSKTRRKILKVLTIAQREVAELSEYDNEERKHPIFSMVFCDSMLSKEEL
ncbi:hypothetical protein OAK75_13575 [Bacteriovoracales bacterium]|nr:hypothetical protein [Bacteriovoracales bacterium]